MRAQRGFVVGQIFAVFGAASVLAIGVQSGRLHFAKKQLAVLTFESDFWSYKFDDQNREVERALKEAFERGRISGKASVKLVEIANEKDAHAVAAVRVAVRRLCNETGSTTTNKNNVQVPAGPTLLADSAAKAETLALLKKSQTTSKSAPANSTN